MLKLNELYKSVKKVVMGAVIIGTLAGIAGCSERSEQLLAGSCLEEYPTMEIDGYSVDYTEDKFKLTSFATFEENIMTATKDGITYVFEDWYRETIIDWRSLEKPDFEKNLLEIIIIKNGDSSKTYDASLINEPTLQGQITKEVFGKLNPLYNYLRTVVRKRMQEDYKKNEKNL